MMGWKLATRCCILAALAATGLELSLPALPDQDKPAAIEQLEEQAIKQAAALVAPSLVRIETVGGLDRVGELLTGTGPTTGVIVSADGYIISSAFNFISKPASILVTLPDGRRQAAEQVATDHLKMLTLLKVTAENLVPAPAAPANTFRVGQWAIALGRTFDDGAPSISVGVVAALKRIWGKALQTDAKISPVNYGGPLVDIEGRVLGILVPLSPQGGGDVAGFEWYDSGIGFAVPLVDVYASLDRLKGGKDLFPGLMGISIKSRDMYEGEPVIDRVRYASPAQQGGIKEGDKVVEIDDQKVVRQTQLLQAMGSKYAGDKITIRVKRGDQTISSELTLIDKLVPYESAFLGILPVRPAVSQPASEGVEIRMVIPDSPAAKAGLVRGDRILTFNGFKPATAAALLDKVSRLRPGEKGKITVQSSKEGGSKTRDVEMTLESIPELVPAEVRPAVIEPGAKGKLDKTLKTGQFSDHMAAQAHDYWAYVPEDYNPNHRYTLVVWLHPGGDTMEASMVKAWQAVCNERGIILLGPKAKQISGWSPDELEFVKDATDLFLEKYSIDPQRVILHGFGDGGQFAFQCAMKYRQTFHGVSAIAAGLSAPPPDNEPDYRLQFHLLVGGADTQSRIVMATALVLRAMKYPLTLTTIKLGDHSYAGPTQVEEISRWMECLDRI